MSVEPTDGFITRDGELVPLEDAERIYELAQSWFDTPEEILAMMWMLGRECSVKGKHADARVYFEKALAASKDDSTKAACMLAIGQVMELQEDYAAAIQWYRKAFVLEPAADETWYFLHINIRYCLNRFGRHQEGLSYYRTAIAIDPDRHNTYKNAGIALEGVERFTEAARSYLQVAEICPADPRALRLLQVLLARHSDTEASIRDIEERIERCQEEGSTAVN